MNPVARVLDGFDDPAASPAEWDRLRRNGDTDVVYLTWQWQRAFWETRGKGELLLIAVERDGELVALAPLNVEHGGMVYFVGYELADYLDVIGDVSDPAVLDTILQTALSHVRKFKGIRLHAIPDQSRTGPLLKEASRRVALSCYHEPDGKVPVLDLPAWAAAKQKPLRHEGFFRGFRAVHSSDGREILPQLPAFFEQNIARFADMPSLSAFVEPSRRRFVELMTTLAADTGWLRFTRIDWEGRSVAYHFGFCHRGIYYGYKSSFAVDLARKSPGHLLDRQVLLAAADEGAAVYDFGGSPEPWKLAFDPRFNRTSTWEMFPKEPTDRSAPPSD